MKKIDFHIHLTDDYPLEKSVENIKALCARNGYETVGIMSIQHLNGSYVKNANEKVMAVKKQIPGAFAFASPVFDGTEYFEQAKQLMAQGFDGIKLLDGKPSESRDLGTGLDHPIVDRFFAYAEKEGIPVLLHNNDPKLHWDITKMNERAIKNGWYYDENMPSFEHYCKALENILEKYPNVKLALAHMAFYADNLDRISYFLEKCPNLYMDITPALIIYEHLSNDIEKAQQFFDKYADRIFYGTDCWSDLENQSNLDYNNKKVKIISHFLTGDGERIIDGQLTRSIKLTRKQIEDIYYNNCKKFVSK